MFIWEEIRADKGRDKGGEKNCQEIGKRITRYINDINSTAQVCLLNQDNNPNLFLCL